MTDADPADAALGTIEERVLRWFNEGLRSLGLQLEPRKGPVDVIVVDHSEKTPSDN